MAKYVRVLAKCSSRIATTAKSCRPFLTRIERFDSTIGDYKILHDDPIPLGWSFIGNQSLDIDREMDFYIDVVAVNNNDNRLTPQTIVDAETFANILKENGRYRFSIAVSGTNIRPARQRIEFEWKGSFDSLTENCF